MRAAKTHIDGLLQLHRVDDIVAMAAVWRQSMAALAAEAVDLRPVPLEGLDPVDLESSMRVALAHGLVDDLDWLSPPHAAAALYELAAALPIGDARRELGRRVLRRLHEGNAETFAILAAQLSMGSRKGLAGPAIHARVALTMDVASSTHGRAPALALSLISHPDLTREWLSVPSTGPLPSRRLAARLLECAAVEVVRRTLRQDDYALAVFEQPAVTSAWNRLLADREPLVWHHVAIARGLLSGSLPHFAEHIERALDPSRTPTEWRRAGVSLAARVGIDPEHGLARCHEVLRGEILQRDPGVASSMVFGLPWAVESEPDAANELLRTLVEIGNLDTLEAFGALRRDVIGAQFVTTASEAARNRINQPHFARLNDDGRIALLYAVGVELGAEPVRERVSELGDVLSRARLAYAETDARAAYALGVELFGIAASALEGLAAAEASPRGRQDEFLALRELDRALLESQTLVNLLWLGATSAESSSLRGVNVLHEQLGDWLMSRESAPIGEADELEQATLQAHRLRALLHLVDANLGVGGDKPSVLRDRRLRMTRLLLGRTSNDAPSPLRRVVCAATARASDALLREEIAELSDVLITVAFHIQDAADLFVLAEASMDPAAASLVHAHASFVQRMAKASQMTGQRARVGLESLGAVIRSFPGLATPRVEALREALLGFADAVQTVQAAQSLTALASDEDLGPSHMSSFADAVLLLARLTAGARRRMGETPHDGAAELDSVLRALDIYLARALRDDDPHGMREVVDAAIAVLREALPCRWADLAAAALVHVSTLPIALPFAAGLVAAPAHSHRGVPLPPWLPPNRVLGGFYVIRPLGTGSVGSVFAACRSEEKGVRDAPRFALKVPEYGGDVARSLSQEEFFRLFREEARALLAVPDHPNLARLVTFDAGARPKPILVMELVEGLTLQRLIDTAALDVAAAFALLDGVAAGLEAMHGFGVGHLDVKPSNVILREPEQSATLADDYAASSDDPLRSMRPGRRAGIPVLVDFGLAGRNVRPGCATVHYGAPELWGHVCEGATPTPADVDTYAFGCLIYETLTGHELFDGPTQMSVITSHIQHDGNLPVLEKMMQRTDFSQLAAVIRCAVRRDPRHRAPLSEIRADLRQAGFGLVGRPWPLSLDTFLPPPIQGIEFSVSQALPLVRKRKTESGQ